MLNSKLQILPNAVIQRRYTSGSRAEGSYAGSISSASRSYTPKRYFIRESYTKAFTTFGTNYKQPPTFQKQIPISLLFVSRNLFIICVLSFVILISGCACVKERVRGFLGISTECLEESRKEAKILTVDYDYFTTYHKVLDQLRSMGSYVYARNSDLIAIYVSSTDTTPVGIFFKELEKQKTQMEISSPSSSARDYIAKEIFSVFTESSVNQEKETVQ